MAKRTAQVSINKKVLQWALSRAQKRGNLDLYFPYWKEWITGEKKPSLKQLEKLARLARIPFGYLFLTEPPEIRLPIPYFRTMKSHYKNHISDALIETVKIISYRQDWLIEYLMSLGAEPLDFVGSSRSTKDAKIIARQIKQKLALDDNWGKQFNTWKDALGFLRRRIENIGIFTFFSSIVGNNTRWPIRVEDFRGFVLVDKYAPAIFVNSSDSVSAQIFTLMHELAHIWIGKSAAFDLRDLAPADNPLEKLCNRVAAEILVPEKQLKHDWSKIHLTLKGNENPFTHLASVYKVSEIVIARKLRDLNLISKKEFQEFYRDYQQRWKTRRESVQPGGEFYRTFKNRLGEKFSSMVIEAVLSGDITYREAYRLTGIYGETFDEFVKKTLRGEI